MTSEELNSLFESIAWNGARLNSRGSLPDDLSFRRFFNNTFSEPWPSYASRIPNLVREPEFDELLRQSIRDAAPELDRWVAENIYRAPEPITACSTNDLDLARRHWVARLLVFDKLFKNEDFIQLVFELDESRRGIKKLLHWGERIRKKHDDSERQEHGNLASVLRGLYTPLTQSLMYVLPVVVGTQVVANHVIEKQKEVYSEKPVIVQPAPAMPSALPEWIASIDRSSKQTQNQVSRFDGRLSGVQTAISNL